MTGRVLEEIEKIKKEGVRSLWQELYDRIDEEFMDDMAIEYHRNKISYRELFLQVDRYAMSLRALGYRKGEEVLACVSDTPEYIYLLLAASKLGLVFHIVGEWFDKDTLIDIFKESHAKRFFITDDNYIGLVSAINESETIEEVVMFSLADSLPMEKGKRVDPYELADSRFKTFKNRFIEYGKMCKKPVIWQEKFLNIGEEYARMNYGAIQSVNPERYRKIARNDDLEPDDLFAITYEEDNSGRPYKRVHSLMDLALAMATDKSADAIRNLRILIHYPAYTYKNVCTCIIEGLLLKRTLVLETIYDMSYFSYSVLLNRPNIVGAPASFWKKLCMSVLFDMRFRGIDLSFLYMPIVDGRYSKGEEKLFNSVSKMKRFGCEKLFFAPSFSEGESIDGYNDVFFRMYDRIDKGFKPLDDREIDILDEEGYPVSVGEYGEVVIDGAGILEKSQEVMEDVMGNVWLRTKKIGVKLDDVYGLQIKGSIDDVIELSSGEKYPLFLLEELVEMDADNVLKAHAVKLESGEVVIYVETQPKGGYIRGKKSLLKSIAVRLHNNMPRELEDAVYLKFRSSVVVLPFTRNGYVDKDALAREGIDETTISYNELKELVTEDAKTFFLTYKS